ncbi:MAG: LuxR C-terminal-related transcriptional regulator [Chloroflexota bacterium]
MVDGKLPAPLDEFKEREIEVLQLMSEGLTNKEIADSLFISRETVRWYCKHIYSKLGTSRRIEAIELAREFGLIGDNASGGDDTITRHTLPLTTGPFIGRDTEMTELKDILALSDVRLLSIVATGGMGKSRISLELAHQIQAQFEHGALFIDLTIAHAPDEITSVILNSIGLTILEGQSADEVLLNYCREKQLLFLFDNFEHVLGGANLLTDLLAVAPNVTIIATSRERLNLRAETVYYLQPVMAHGQTLFTEVATMMRPNVVIRDDEQEAIQRIVDNVGGSPLALILAATWVDILSVAEIADEIEASLDFLSAEMGDMPARQRSIHAVIEPTWKRLTAKEQQAFMWAAVFRGGFTREIFQQMTGVSVRVLQTLLSRSLIVTGHGRRYSMHPLLSQFAHEKLDSTDQLEDAKLAHLKVYIDYATTYHTRMYEGHYLESLELLDVEQDNFRAALDWGLAGHAVEDAVQLIYKVYTFWSIRSQFLEARDYLERALSQIQTAYLHHMMLLAKWRLGQLENTEDDLALSLAMAQSEGDDVLIARAYLQNGLYIEQAHPHEAKKFYEKAITIAEQSDDLSLLADSYIYLGMISNDLDDDMQAGKKAYEKALAIYEQRGDLRGMSIVTYNIALINFFTGETRKANELVIDSLQLKRQIGDKAGEARRLSVLAMWAIMEEEFEQSREYLVSAHSIVEKIVAPRRLIYILDLQGLLAIIMGDYATAKSYFEEALHLSQQVEAHNSIVSCRSYLALVHLLLDDLDTAKTHIQNAIANVTMTKQELWFVLVVIANYHWYANTLDACVPIVASLKRNPVPENFRVLDKRYFFEPLVYRVQQHIGDDAWQEALHNATDTTTEQMLEIVQSQNRFK